jgi:Squalene-hopene cyclase N-terminal domain
VPGNRRRPKTPAADLGITRDAWIVSPSRLEPYLPADAKEAAAARASRDKADAWLSKTKSSESTQAISLCLLLDARRGAAEKQLQVGIDRLLKRQNPDGGWSQTADMPSDAYATGQALYALSFADVKNDHPQIQ